ncbi:MAG: exonuclease domain-containing protein [Planctomycetes bacterium]|nr:exonuclease domain-containing protein [Planctomycetota bacterium]
MRHYLVIDLEATCSNDRSIPRHEMEIIEIGAVMVATRTLESLSEFRTFVKPVRNPRLSAFCTELTGIRQEDVDPAPRWAGAVERLIGWAEPFAPFLFCSWGDYDRRQLEQDCLFHKVAYPFGRAHGNVKILFGRSVSMPPMGLGTALRRLGLPFEGREHRGIDDARNVVRIMRAIPNLDRL